MTTDAVTAKPEEVTISYSLDPFDNETSLLVMRIERSTDGSVIKAAAQVPIATRDELIAMRSLQASAYTIDRAISSHEAMVVMLREARAHMMGAPLVEAQRIALQ